MKKLASFILSLSGWKVVGPMPKECMRCVMTAAPHTSNWDAYYVRMAFFVLGIPLKLAIKDNWTKFPFSLITKPLGIVGIKRKYKPGEPKKNQVTLLSDFFKEYDDIALVIAPEGTRSRTEKWKMGFYHIAKKAGVPIALGYLDYAKKEAGVGGILFPTDDMQADLKAIMDFYSTITPRIPENFVIDQQYLVPAKV